MPSKLSLAHMRGHFSSLKVTPSVRVTARQLRDKNCLAAIFAPRHQGVSFGPLGSEFLALRVTSQQLKKGVFSKGVLAEIACNVIFPLRSCAQRLHDSSARRCLVQNVGCCDANAPQGTKILSCRIGTRRAQCRGGSAVHSALQGSAENWRPNFRHFPTFSAPLVLQCLTSRM